MNTMHGESVRLRDGRRVCLRPFRPEDRLEITALLERLSPRSRVQRFHSAGMHITSAVLDQVTAGRALVAEVEGRVVALASYFPLPDGSEAEVGIVVDDGNQRCGIGTALCAYLSRDAQRAGIRRLRADVLSTNDGMLRLLRGLNLPLSRTFAHGVEVVDIALCSAAA
jgi:GNAT superfamily N-acetyltransferase